MSASLFKTQKHVIPGQHIRQYPHATANEQEELLHLVIKQYTPLSNPSPRKGDVTIIGAHANGFPKELYEPLWDEILKCVEARQIRIRAIWIADVAHQGESGIHNEGKLGNDPSWYDHPRDLLHMVNTFRAEMPRPIFGIGHSMGGNNLVNLSLLHARLLAGLVLIDPIIQRFSSALGNFSPAQASAFRRDRWPSRQAAAAAFRQSKFYQSWDPRVLDLWIRYGLRELPTALYPETDVSPEDPDRPLSSSDGEKERSTREQHVTTTSPIPASSVTLTPTKHQEVFTFLRPNFHHNPRFRPYTHPDIPPSAYPNTPFYRPEAVQTFSNLPYLRPSVLYVFGENSPLCAPAFRADKLAATGTGVGGSGGAPAGRVREVLLKGAGHLVPMERVAETAEAIADWLAVEMERWRDEERFEQEEWGRMESGKKAVMSREFLEALKGTLSDEKPSGQKPEPKL